MKRSCIFLIFIFIVTGAGYASYDQALELYQQKKYAESLKILGDELTTENDFKEGSSNFKIRYLAAHDHWKLGNKEAVINHFKRCMEIKKDEVAPYIDLSLFLTEISKYNDADAIAQKGLKIKQDPMLYYVIGKISLLRGNFWRAKEFFEKANSYNQDYYFSYNSLGIALMNLKKYSEANTAFTIASTLFPDSPQILNNLGMSYEMLAKNDKAYECFEKANLLDKNDKTILENFNRVKGKKGK